MNDPINPNHYKSDKGFEAIDVMREAAQSPEAFQAHLQCTALKYLYRMWRKENPLQDAKKSLWYLQALIAELETVIDESNDEFTALQLDLQRGKISRHQYELQLSRIRNEDKETAAKGSPKDGLNIAKQSKAQADFIPGSFGSS